jgi:3-oxoacyl-(acyl-carrier-protein) synthase
MIQRHRALITAWQAVLPIGCGGGDSFGEVHGEIFSAIQNAQSATGVIENFNTQHYPLHSGAEARENGVVISTPGNVDRKSLLAEKALDALVSQKENASLSQALVCGTGIDHFDFPGYADAFGNLPEQAEQGWKHHTRSSVQAVREMCTGFGLAESPSVNVAACVASSQALGMALRKIRRGVPQLVSGGFDSMLSPMHYMGFYKLGALSTWEGAESEACRPLDKDRCGIVLGEGAAFFQIKNAKELESGEYVWGEISGYASTMDSYLVTDPEPDGKWLALAMEKAIGDAGLKPQDIDCVHLHGTGTVKNDLAETRAMEKVFGERFGEIPVYSMKGQIGHLIGACGAAELCGVLYSLKNQCVPVTVNSVNPDEKVPLNVQRNQELQLPIRHVLKLNAAFGGQNTALVISAAD